MGLVNIETASPEDDKELREMIRRIPMEGQVRVSFGREPSYFEALKAEGLFSQIVVGRDAKREIIGVGNRSVRDLYVNGKPEAVGYLSSLRVVKEFRQGTALFRGYKFFRELHKDKRTRFYLTTIVEDNSEAMKALAGNRKGMPVYHDLGRIISMTVSLSQKCGLRNDSSCHVRTAGNEDLARIETFLADEGRKRQFFPLYESKDISEGKGLLKGMKAEDMLLAFRGDEIWGMAAAWDQQGFRQVMIDGYNPPLSYIRPVYNFLAPPLGYPALPSAGTQLPCFYLSLVCIREDDERVFESLLSVLMEKYRAFYRVMICGGHERSPLLKVLRRLRHFEYKSRLYLVYYPDMDGDVPGSIDMKKIPCLELGAL